MPLRQIKNQQSEFNNRQSIRRVEIEDWRLAFLTKNRRAPCLGGARR